LPAMNDYCPEMVDVLGVTIPGLTRGELLDQIVSTARSARRVKVMYANVHVLNTAYSDRELWRALNQADLVYCDGAGVRLAACLLPDRITGADWFCGLSGSVKRLDPHLFSGRVARDRCPGRRPALRAVSPARDCRHTQRLL